MNRLECGYLLRESSLIISRKKFNEVVLGDVERVAATILQTRYHCIDNFNLAMVLLGSRSVSINGNSYFASSTMRILRQIKRDRIKVLG